MELIIFIIFAFLVIVYVNTFLKIRRKKRMRNHSEVLEFNKKYHKNLSINYDKEQTDKDSEYKKYVTKYNSTIDYVSKDEYF